jgi:hypothetical protein
MKIVFGDYAIERGEYRPYQVTYSGFKDLEFYNLANAVNHIHGKLSTRSQWPNDMRVQQQILCEILEVLRSVSESDRLEIESWRTQ